MCYSLSSTERNVSMHMDTGSNLGFYQFEISPPPPPHIVAEGNWRVGPMLSTPCFVRS